VPKLSTRPPKYTCHKASGQATVKFGGKVRYLGRFGSPESKAAYQAAIAEWARQTYANPSTSPPAPSIPSEETTTIDELLLAYLKHAEVHYRRDGQPTGTMDTLKPILKTFRGMFTRTQTKDFRPSYLEAFQKQMIARGCSRSYINDATARIKGMFRWGVRRELVPVDTLHRLETVPGLAKGRTEARETEPVEPVDDAVVDTTLPHLPSTIADMVRLQRLIGGRPQDVCNIRPADVNRSGDVWLYRPGSHKTKHHGKSRVVCIGPRAQEILLPYLLRAPESYCFSPRESERERAQQRRAERQTPLTPSQTARKKKRSPKRAPNEQYTHDSYRRAIHRACDRAFPPPNGLAQTEGESRRQWLARLTPKQREELQHWQSAHRWAPNQLRHAAGTAIRSKYGLEAAQVVLGHSKASTTEIYAERDLRLAVQVAREVG
jgi:site-specific recombinase XerD